ncbi:NUDIX hydrolase [Deinococcus radiophilus]|uniref:CoA pyrophosphatase n=1 Tax=Deinococcus radiophilus TaxID=32062 RepID=A0A3S0JTH3_9DEIO|nr:CoA pyrophosphatase [Deinococcus radiophilus]RTR28628.1 CoA pyrophosphatase [Deinococcus radiophilus]UFA51050.1 CoA pyrophosphatase [Deinococcus radiophilus]
MAELPLDPLDESLLYDPAADPWAGWVQARQRQRLHLPDYREAAVLAALSLEAVPRVLLTIRSAELPTHQGQVAFAGGKLEAGETPVQAALREAQEEVGLAPEAVTVLGELDDVFTPLGFHVTPVLARFALPDRFRLSGEVDRVLLCSLDELRASAAPPTLKTMPNGREYPMYEYLPQGVRVWGMTARILHDLLDAGVD